MWDIKVSCIPPSYNDHMYDYLRQGERISDRKDVPTGWGMSRREWVEQKRKWVYIRVIDPGKYKRIMEHFAEYRNEIFSLQIQRLEF